MFSRGHSRATVSTLGVWVLMSFGSVAVMAAVSSAHSTPPPPRLLAYVTGTAKTLPAVWVAQSSGAEPKRLGPGDSALISPDGESVAAALFGATGNSEVGPSLAVYSTTGAPVNEYLSLATATSTPLAWSPDSRYLAVSLMSTGVKNIARQSGLAVIDTQKGTVTTVVHGQISGASFAPDGTDRLVFGRAPSLAVNASSNLYVSNPDGSGVKPLTHDGRSLNPLWGPQYIAYDRERLRKNYAPIYEIWLSPLAGGRARRLTHTRVGKLVVGLVPLAFSSSGARMLAEFGGEDTSEAWTLSIPSGRARRLTLHGEPVVGAGLSGDGSTVLIDDQSLEGPPSNGRVATMPFGGGPATTLVAHGSQASWNL